MCTSLPVGRTFFPENTRHMSWPRIFLVVLREISNRLEETHLVLFSRRRRSCFNVTCVKKSIPVNTLLTIWEFGSKEKKREGCDVGPRPGVVENEFEDVQETTKDRRVVHKLVDSALKLFRDTSWVFKKIFSL